MNPLATQPSACQRLAQASSDFAHNLRHSQELLQQASHDHVQIKQASSLGAEDVVISHLIAKLGLPIRVFVLDTGALHHQTLALLERQQAAGRLDMEVHRPEPSQVIQWVAKHGQNAIHQSIDLRKDCCRVRKLEPLARALNGQTAWVTGLRREQSDARAEVPDIDDSEQASTGRVKYNPLAHWTLGDVWHYIAQEKIDYNPLHDDFYPSIGCAPCTRAISLGEPFRAGRWWWEEESAKECGLHQRTA
ncbi:MAG: phosphoadenylyl-sulfate reductase [Alphaproteobacteria bacterium]|nr:phosphoadenylyl-sulfate reductase [Alphaproteobacteria bacterium]